MVLTIIPTLFLKWGMLSLYWYDMIDKYLPRNWRWHDLFLADESPFRIPESENKGICNLDAIFRFILQRR